VAAFYADENFRYPVVEALRRLGHGALEKVPRPVRKAFERRPMRVKG
jgi:hypothetical protein